MGEAGQHDEELGFLIALMTDWANTLGLKEIRADPQHNFVSTATVDPTEESCGVLHEQLSMLVAQFGIKFPNGSKFKAAFIYISDLHALWPTDSLKKDVDSWADYQAAVLRLHATYVVRLWRKTPYRSKSETVQLIKDILNEMYLQDDQTNAGDASGDGDTTSGAAVAGESADASSTHEVSADAGSANEVAMTSADASSTHEVSADAGNAHEVAESLDPGCSDPMAVADALASGEGGTAGSEIDNMPTLPMWPPNPDVPKSSLKRWTTKQDWSEMSEADGDLSSMPTCDVTPSIEEPSSANPLVEADAASEAGAGCPGEVHVESALEDALQEAVESALEDTQQEAVETAFDDALEKAVEPPLEDALEKAEEAENGTSPGEETKDKVSPKPRPCEADRSPLVSDPPDLHEVLAGLTLDEIDLSQHSHDLLAEQAKLRSRARKDHQEKGEEPSGRGRGKGRGRGRGRGGTKRPKEELEPKEPSAASSSVAKKQKHENKSGCKRTPESVEDNKLDGHDEPSQKPRARKQKKAHVIDAEEEERIKATIPSLQHYKVTPYWTTGNVGVEMKAMPGMKKKEVGFINSADMPNIKMFEIVQVCNKLANDLEGGMGFTESCAAFCDARVKLQQKSFLLANPGSEGPNAGS